MYELIFLWVTDKNKNAHDIKKLPFHPFFCASVVWCAEVVNDNSKFIYGKKFWLVGALT